jgi:3D (Asp-Asp-Asp) domain-containing protein
MKQRCLLFVFFVVSFVLVPESAFAYRSGTRLLLATVTAYTSSPKAVTASGAPAFDGVVACPRKYPFGSRFEIEGRIYECRDRLSPKYGDRFDIWKPTHRAARLFGKRTLPVVVVMPANRPPWLIAASLHLRLTRV